MASKFNRSDFRIIVMTGGSLKWHLDAGYLRDKDDHTGTLTEISSEYNQVCTVAYKNNKNVGKATMTITGKGGYAGTITKAFKVNPKGTSIAKLTKGKKAGTVEVTWKKQPAKMSKSRITGYQVQLATNKSFTKGKKTVTVKGYKNLSKKVAGLKDGKKYYAKIRTYKKVGSVKYYSSWSKTKTVTTK